MDSSGSPWVRQQRWSARTPRLVLWLVWVLVTAALVGLLAFIERSARDELSERFQLRLTVTARFLDRYLADEANLVQATGTRYLAGPAVTQADFDRTVAGLGFTSAVLLDERGRVIVVRPPNPAVLGRDITRETPHLGVALREDRPAVSGLVTTAGGNPPFVALAVPFETGTGRRVLSGAIPIQGYPLGDYLDHAISLPATQIYLVDQAGMVVASNTRGGPAGQPERIEPALAGIEATDRPVPVRLDGQRLLVAGQPVPDTPWHLVAAVPPGVLLRPVAGMRTWGPRALLAALVLGALGAVVGTAHLLDTREALRFSETRYREFFDDSVVGMLVSMPDGRVARANRALCELIGRSEPEILGTTWEDHTHPDDMAASAEMFQRALAGELSAYTIEKRYLHADGHVLYVLVSTSLVRDADGRPLHFATQVLDLTARRRAEQATANMAAVVSSSDDAIISKDLNGIVTSWNPAAERLYGWTAAEMIGQRVHRIAPEGRAGEIDDILAAIAEDQTVQNYESIRRSKDGTVIPVSLTISPIHEGGRVVGASVITRDITLRRQWETALADRAALLEVANAELREANQLKSDLVAMLSHDVGQPLSVIRGYAEMLDDGWERTAEGERRRMVTGISAAVDRLTLLVDEVLAMARTDATSLEAAPVPVALAAAVADAVAAVGQRVREVMVRPVGAIEVMADPVHLHQMLVNLITNASKYGRPPIEIDAAVAGDLVELRVTDHGEGVPDGFEDQLFDRFTRAGEVAGRVEGSGLGLFIVRKLAEADGGQVRYERAPGGGARFVISLRRAGVLASERRVVLE